MLLYSGVTLNKKTTTETYCVEAKFRAPFAAQKQ